LAALRKLKRSEASICEEKEWFIKAKLSIREA